MIRKTQDFTQEERDKIAPKIMCDIILNNLHEFNNCPEKIKNLIDKFDKLNDNDYNNPLKPFLTAFSKVYEFYKTQNHFPDMDLIETTLKDLSIQRRRENYSNDIYDYFADYLDRQIIKLIVSRNIVDKDFDDEDLDSTLTAISAQRNKKISDIKRLTKEEIIDLGRKNEEKPPGVKTGIQEIDDVIIELPCGSISLINAPSGSGKTLISSTILYNMAVQQGKHVIYVAFEAQEEELWFNLSSIDSTYEDKNFSHSAWKLRIGGDRDKEKRIKTYKECSTSVLNKVEEKGGYINILTPKTMPETSFEDFCARLEMESKLQGKKAELIIIDNVDNLGLFPFKGVDFRTVMNNRISHLDTFSSTYSNNEGTHILLLSQSNRIGMEKLEENEDSGSDMGNDLLNKPRVQSRKRKPIIDYRVVSDYSALYQKAKVALVCAASDESRRKQVIKVYFIKMRDTGKPADPIEITADFAHSRVGGKITGPSLEGFLEFQKKEDELKETKEINDAPSLDYDFMED